MTLISTTIKLLSILNLKFIKENIYIVGLLVVLEKIGAMGVTNLRLYIAYRYII